jgi:hypothetical protein
MDYVLHRGALEAGDGASFKDSLKASPDKHASATILPEPCSAQRLCWDVDWDVRLVEVPGRNVSGFPLMS